MHRTDKLNHLVSLAKRLSVRLRTKWLWIRIVLLSLNHSHLMKPFFYITEKLGQIYIYIYISQERKKSLKVFQLSEIVSDPGVGLS